MFWNKKKKISQLELVGASAKLAAAQRMRNSSRMDMHNPDAKGQAHSQTIPVVITFVLCAVLTIILMEGSFINISSFHPTGINNLDSLLVGSQLHKFVSDSDVNRLIIIMIRSTFLFIMTGIIPLMGFIASGMFKMGKLNPFIASWTAIVALPVLIFLVKEMLFPMLEQLVNGF